MYRVESSTCSALCGVKLCPMHIARLVGLVCLPLSPMTFTHIAVKRDEILQEAIRASDRAVLAFYGPGHPSALTCHPAASYNVRLRSLGSCTLLTHVVPLPDTSAGPWCMPQHHS